MEDIECPYCEAQQEINHDDGYGYTEDEIFEQECDGCGKTFAYTTSISFYYDATKADCLNDGTHKFVPVIHMPRWWPDYKRCTDCGYENQGKRDEEAVKKFREEVEKEKS